MKQGKKIKFKALAIRQPDQTNELINKINDVMDNPESETVTGKYYQVEEFPRLVSDLDNSLLFSFKGHLCFKTITSQNVLSEAQFKNFFIF